MSISWSPQIIHRAAEAMCVGRVVAEVLDSYMENALSNLRADVGASTLPSSCGFEKVQGIWWYGAQVILSHKRISRQAGLRSFQNTADLPLGSLSWNAVLQVYTKLRDRASGKYSVVKQYDLEPWNDAEIVALHRDTCCLPLDILLEENG